MERVRRFTTTEIVYHWAQALPYLALASTGVALWAGHFVSLGPEAREWNRTAHLVSACFQVGLPALVFFFADRTALFRNMRRALRWERRDFVWLWRVHLRILSRRVTLPEVGFFNAGQKLNYLLVLVGIPAMALSGLVMFFFPGVFLAWFVHLGVFCVTIPMLLVHLWMACVNPSTNASLRGIFQGTVPRQWAEHHHGDWLRSEEPRAAGPESAEPARPQVPTGPKRRARRRRKTRLVSGAHE